MKCSFGWIFLKIDLSCSCHGDVGRKLRVLLPVLNLEDGHGDLGNALYFTSKDYSPVLLAPRAMAIDDADRRQRRHRDVNFLALFLTVTVNRLPSDAFNGAHPELVTRNFGSRAPPYFRHFRDALLQGEHEAKGLMKFYKRPLFFQPDKDKLVEHVKMSNEYYQNLKKTDLGNRFENAWDEFDWITAVDQFHPSSYVRQYFMPNAAKYSEPSDLLRFVRNAIVHFEEVFGFGLDWWGVLSLFDMELNFLWRLFKCHIYVHANLLAEERIKMRRALSI